ncbi:hypothetical protein BD779DRAFT_1227682 [Infundibulicybe gibba]|nr:hypothetical protein BD779DRAFT_1227682 [Infundibulicybe gibba]
MESGTYTINSVRADAYIGPAATLEYPMRIISFLHGTQAPRFAIEKLPHGYYLIKANGVLACVISNLVFTIDSGPLREEWIITCRENHGPNAYTIEKAGHMSRGWVLHGPEADPAVPVEPGTQVACDALAATFSDPPQYLPSGLWVINAAPPIY